jgi:7-carboxy-7-deazaguanine synthase
MMGLCQYINKENGYMKMDKYKVVEKFVSINGEGKRAGELACFIRFAGCNLNCSYCDTHWANEPEVAFELLDTDEIIDFINESGALNVTLTGGEPLLQGEDKIKFLINEILNRPDSRAERIEIETNGAVSIRPFTDYDSRVSLTMDYKLPGSGMEEYMLIENFGYLRKNDTVKFVISDEKDMARAAEIVKEYRLDERFTVYFSTAFSRIKPADVVAYMIEHKLNRVKLQLQLHKYIWEPDKRGV